MDGYSKTHTRGISSVEMLVGISIAALILLFVTHAITRFVNVGQETAEKTKALYLAEEGLELVRFVRDESWSNISTLTDGTTYYLDVSSTTVAISGTPEVIDGYYERSFVVDAVERDGNDDIVTSGTADPQSKYVTVTVSWDTPTQTTELTSIIADISNP